MVLEVLSSQLLGPCHHYCRDEISLMELDVANETWGFMSPVSGRSCPLLELHTEVGTYKGDDDDGDDNVDDDQRSHRSNVSLFSSTSKKSKKRVQFQADDNLELVYEIPPRGHYSSTEESDSDDSTDDENDDQSSSDSSLDSLEMPYDSSSTKSRAVSSKSPTSLNAALSHSSSFYNNNISPARGSYNVCRSKDRGSSVVAKITGVTPFHSNMSGGDKNRSSGRRERYVKLTNVSSSCSGNSEEKQKTRRRGKGTRKRASVKKADAGKSAVVLKRPKEPIKTFTNVTPRRCSSASIIVNGRRASLARSSFPSKGLPPARPRSEMSFYSTHKTPNSTARLFGQRDVRVGDSLKNLSLGKVYTIDGFIFPQDPVDQISKRSTVELNPPNARDVSPQSSDQRKRCLSWKMANASSQSPVMHTPCILPLWDSIQSVSLVSKPSVKTKF